MRKFVLLLLAISLIVASSAENVARTSRNGFQNRFASTSASKASSTQTVPALLIGFDASSDDRTMVVDVLKETSGSAVNFELVEDEQSQTQSVGSDGASLVVLFVNTSSEPLQWVAQLQAVLDSCGDNRCNVLMMLDSQCDENTRQQAKSMADIAISNAAALCKHRPTVSVVEFDRDQLQSQLREYVSGIPKSSSPSNALHQFARSSSQTRTPKSSAAILASKSAQELRASDFALRLGDSFDEIVSSNMQNLMQADWPITPSTASAETVNNSTTNSSSSSATEQSLLFMDAAAIASRVSELRQLLQRLNAQHCTQHATAALSEYAAADTPAVTREHFVRQTMQTTRRVLRSQLCIMLRALHRDLQHEALTALRAQHDAFSAQLAKAGKQDALISEHQVAAQLRALRVGLYRRVSSCSRAWLAATTPLLTMQCDTGVLSLNHSAVKPQPLLPTDVDCAADDTQRVAVAEERELLAQLVLRGDVNPFLRRFPSLPPLSFSAHALVDPKRTLSADDRALQANYDAEKNGAALGRAERLRFPGVTSDLPFDPTVRQQPKASTSFWSLLREETENVLRDEEQEDKPEPPKARWGLGRWGSRKQ